MSWKKCEQRFRRRTECGDEILYMLAGYEIIKERSVQIFFFLIMVP